MKEQEVKDLVYCGQFVCILTCLSHSLNAKSQDIRYIEQLIDLLENIYNEIRSNIVKKNIDYYIIRNGGFKTFNKFYKFLRTAIKKEDTKKIERCVSHIERYISRDMRGYCFWDYLIRYFVRNKKKASIEELTSDLRDEKKELN